MQAANLKVKSSLFNLAATLLTELSGRGRGDTAADQGGWLATECVSGRVLQNGVQCSFFQTCLHAQIKLASCCFGGPSVL